MVAGALRGLVRAVIALGAMLIGLIVAARGYEVVGLLLQEVGLVSRKATANAGGFLLIVGLSLLLGLVVGGMVRGRLKRARLGGVDRTLGAVFGLVRGLAVCSMIYLALTAFPVRLRSVTDARTAPVLAQGAKTLSLLTSSDLRTRFYEEYRRLTT